MAANLAAAEGVIRAVLRHEHAYLFEAPVDPVLLGIPTYFDVIKTPMDLGTILTRLTRRQYASAGEVLRDANLVWHNCLTFNPPGDPVTVACGAVRQRFNELWRTAALPLTPAPPAAAPPRAAPAAPPSHAPPPRADKKRRAPPPPRPAEPLSGEDDLDLDYDEEEREASGAPATSARCAVCQVQRKGKCGTPTAPARCHRRTPGMAVVVPPRRDRDRGGAARPQAASEPGPPSAAAVAARARAQSELAAAQAALHAAQAQLSSALAAEGAARDAVRGMRPHDAPEPQLAPPGWVPRPARLTPAAHALASFWWGLPRPLPPARAA